MQIFLAKQIDSIDIWKWRNDVRTRTFSIVSDWITWDEHSSWYFELLNDANRFLYIGELDGGKKVGVCRFDINAERSIAMVSINLNPEMRGKNLASELLSASIQVFGEENKIALKAIIKKTNTTSIKCFTRCGFVLCKDDQEYGHYIFEV